MLLFRSLTIGLLGACIVMLARQPLSPPEAPAPAPSRIAAAATIVDIAPGVVPSTIPSLIRLLPGERVVAVGDRSVETELAAGAAIARALPGAGEYVDLDVAGASGEHRRVLVLVH